MATHKEKAQETPVLALNEVEAARALRVSLSWLQHDRIGRRLIPFYKLGKLVRYNPDRIKAAIARHEEGGNAA